MRQACKSDLEEKARRKPVAFCYYEWRREVEGIKRMLAGAELYLEHCSEKWVDNNRAYYQARLDYIQDAGPRCKCTNKTGCQSRERKRDIRKQVRSLKV